MKRNQKVWRSVATSLVAISMLVNPVFAYTAKKVVTKEDTTAKQAEQAIEQEKREQGIMTFDKAVELATANNSQLKTLANNVDVWVDSRERLAYGVQVNVPSGEERVTMESSVLSMLKSIDGLDTSIDNAKYTEQVLKVSIPMAVMNYFITIKNDESTLENAKAGYTLAQENFNNAGLMLELGMVSQVDYDKMKDSLEQTRQSIQQLELAIQSDYTNFKDLLGMRAEDELILDEYSVELEPLTMEMSLDTYVTQQIEKDPTIKSLEAAIHNAEFNLNTYTYSAVEESYKSKQAKVAEANRSYTDAKKAKDVAIRDTYNQILQLEANQKSYEAALATAQKDLETAKTNYEVGNITKLAYDQAALKVESAKLDIQKNIYNHTLLMYRFENPCLLSK